MATQPATRRTVTGGLCGAVALAVAMGVCGPATPLAQAVSPEAPGSGGHGAAADARRHRLDRDVGERRKGRARDEPSPP